MIFSRWFEPMLRDVVYGMRVLQRSGTSSAIIVLTLALGIGATTTIFSVVEAVLLRPLPYRDPAKLVIVFDSPVHERGSEIFIPYRHFLEWKKQSDSFSGLAAMTWSGGQRVLVGRGAPQPVFAPPASVDFFDVLGVGAQLGRTFTPDDLTRACTVVLSHKFWQTRLAASPDVLRQPLNFEDSTCTVAGVMPPGFAFYPVQADMWMLISATSPHERNPDSSSVAVIGRLRPGVSLASGEAELRTRARQIDNGRGFGIELEPLAHDLRGEFTWLAGRNLRLSLIVLFAAVAFILAIACVNVANLLLGRGAAREREIAIRAALGSSRARLLRQLLTESLLLSMVAAMFAIAIAEGGVYYFKIAKPIELPPGATVGLNLPVLAFTAALALLTTLAAGFAPAWRAAKTEVGAALKSGSRGSMDRSRRRFSSALIVAEMALSLVLLAGAGLLIRSIANFAHAPLGFNPEGLGAMTVRLPKRIYSTPAQITEFYDRARASLASMPGVESAAMTNRVAIQGSGGFDKMDVEGRTPANAQDVPSTEQQDVSDGYFSTMGIRVMQGREFTWADRAGQTPAAVVNQAFVEKYFPREDPIGRRVRTSGDKNPWLTIVGVVANEKQGNVFREMDWANFPILYHSLAQETEPSFDLVFRGSATPASVQQTIVTMEPNSVISEVETLDQAIGLYLAYPRFRAILMGAFAALALLLAAVGLYGVLAQLVGERTREIGIRMALGAGRKHVLGMVVKDGMLLAAIGAGLGLLASVWLTRFIASLLYGVTAQDPATIGGGIAVLIAAALLATYIPARRAARVDPMISLRSE